MTKHKPKKIILPLVALSLIPLWILGFANLGKNHTAPILPTPIETPVLVRTQGEVSQSNAPTEITLQIASDIHHLAPELREDNEVFQTFLDSGDGKLLKYATEILYAMGDTIKRDVPEVLLITGDLTTNGELKTHQWLRDYFEQIEASGTEVFVLPGNHDINNPYATDFSTGVQRRVDSISPEAFMENYRNFGYEQAFSRDPASLSYAVRLTDTLYLLMLDTCKYEDNVALGYPVMEGALRPETLSWISEVKGLIDAESAGNANIITASHHNTLAHSPVHSEGFVIDNSTESVKTLNELGTILNFSGHIHIQDITEDAKAKFMDIATGSLLQYPQTFGVLKVSEASQLVTYETQWVEVEAYAERMGLTDPALLDFKRYAQAVFKAQSAAMIGDRLDGQYTESERSAMAETLSELNSRYFAGTDSKDKESILSSEGYKLWNDSELGFFKQYVQSMLLDEGDDNTLIIDLK